MAGSPAVQPRGLVSSLETNIALALIASPVESIEKGYVAHSSFLKGRLARETGDIKYENGGCILRYETSPGYSAASNGSPRAGGFYTPGNNAVAFSNLAVTQQHLLWLQSTQAFDESSAEIITDPEELANLGEKLSTRAIDGLEHYKDVLRVAGRQGICGEVFGVSVGAAVSQADTPSNSDPFGSSDGITPISWSGYFPVTLTLGGHTNIMAFQNGRDFQVCAAPTDWLGAQSAAIVTLRNFSVPGRVLGRFKMFNNPSVAGGYYQVVLAFPFVGTVAGNAGNSYSGSTTNAQYNGVLDVYAQLTGTTSTNVTVANAITVGDVITMWGTNLTSSGAVLTGITGQPYGGPNNGWAGLQWIMSANNIETAIGSGQTYCSVPFKSVNYAGQAFTTVNRGDPGSDFLVPSLFPQYSNGTSGTRTKVAWDMLGSLTLTMAGQNGEDPMGTNVAHVMNPLVLQSLLSQVPGDQIKVNASLYDERKAWYAHYGFGGGVYQAPWTGGPINLVTTMSMPLDAIYAFDPTNLREIRPGAPKWKTNGSGGYLLPITLSNPAGGQNLETDRHQMIYKEYSQLFARNMKQMAAITGITP